MAVRFRVRGYANGKPIKHNSLCQELARKIADRVYGDDINIGQVSKLRIFDQDGNLIKEIPLKDKSITEDTENHLVTVRFVFDDMSTDSYTWYYALVLTDQDVRVVRAKEDNGVTKEANKPFRWVFVIDIPYAPE